MSPSGKEWQIAEAFDLITRPGVTAHFIAHAPDDIRALLAEVDALRTVVRLAFEFKRGANGRVWYNNDPNCHVDPSDAEYADVLRVVEWLEGEHA